MSANSAACNDGNSDQSDVENLSSEDDLLFLKNCIVKKTDSNVIVSKLQSTRELRTNMMADTKLDLRESFPFFFVEPKLVNYRFSIWLHFISLHVCFCFIDCVGFRKQPTVSMQCNCFCWKLAELWWEVACSRWWKCEDWLESGYWKFAVAFTSFPI